jgi:hypothetical protein
MIRGTRRAGPIKAPEEATPAAFGKAVGLGGERVRTRVWGRSGPEGRPQRAR